jgi:hypothetical protein
MEEQVTLEQIIAVLEEAKKDYEKFYDKGVKAASTRVRKSLQDVVKLSKTLRNQITEHKKTLE